MTRDNLAKENYLHTYYYIESSQDERSWTIESEVQLTEEGVKEIAQGSSMTDGYTETGGATGERYLLKFDGTEWGDDIQSEVQGDLLDDAEDMPEDEEETNKETEVK